VSATAPERQHAVSSTPVRPLVPALVVAVLLLVTATAIGRDLWFFSDDWNIFADYHDGDLLTPFNGHLSLLPAGIYQLLFHTVGVDSYLPYRLAGLASLAVLAFQVLRLAGVRLGDVGARSGERGRRVLGPALGALVVAAVLWNSSGQMNLLFPFLMNFSLPIAALVAIWWHLDRADAQIGDRAGDRAGGGAADVEHDGVLRHEVAASVWLVVALATSGLGLMTMAAVGVELLVARAAWRRWSVMSPGPILWAIWYVANRGANEVSTDVSAVVSYSARMFLGATTSIAAGIGALGVVLAIAVVGFFVIAALRWRSLDARTLGALAAPATFIVFTAVTRLDIVPEIPPDELRYSWAVAAYLVLAVVLAARRRALFDVRVPTAAWWAASGVAALVLVVGAVRLVGDLDDWNTQVATARPGLSTVLFATEAVGAERIDPDVVIPLSYVPVTTGGYLAGVASVGSPIAEATAEDLGGAAYNRRFADELLVDQLDIEARPQDGTPCAGVPVDPVGPDGVLELLPGSVIELEGVRTGPLRLSRFARNADGQELPAPAEGTVRIEIPADDDSVASMPGIDQRYPYRLFVAGATPRSACG
jgi:hypothetical protein